MTGRRLTGEERETLRRAIDRKRRRSLRLLTAEEFLLDMLEAGPRSFDELAATAREAGITLQELRRAARRLQVVGRDGDTWSLPTSGRDER